jgi:hypothetical protein
MTMKITRAPFNLSVSATGRPKITRELEFSNGDTIVFTVTLEEDETATLTDLHRRSVEEVIERLQAWLKPSTPAKE